MDRTNFDAGEMLWQINKGTVDPDQRGYLLQEACHAMLVIQGKLDYACATLKNLTRTLE